MSKKTFKVLKTEICNSDTADNNPTTDYMLLNEEDNSTINELSLDDLAELSNFLTNYVQNELAKQGRINGKR